jgi:hypothetical protein
VEINNKLITECYFDIDTIYIQIFCVMQRKLVAATCRRDFREEYLRRSNGGFMAYIWMEPLKLQLTS